MNLNNIMKVNYGYYVRNYRRMRAMSQMDLEIETGLSFGSISRIENGKLNPTKETLFKIIRALGLNIEEAIEIMGIQQILN